MTEQFRSPNPGRYGAPFFSSIEIRPSERSGRIRYAIRDIMVLADQARAVGREITYLNIGDPLLYDFPTPAHVIESTHRAMLAGHNGYAPSQGVGEAIEAIRREALGKGFRNIQDIFVSSGVSEGIEISTAALVDPGDNLLIPAPGYPLYEATLVKLGCEAIFYHLDEDNGWQPDPDEIARLITPRTRGIVVLNPNNPTGSICSREILKGILDLSARHGLVAISDEIYDKLIFDPDGFVPLATISPEQPVVTFNGLSKSYLVPGFRVGWGILTGEEHAVSEYREAINKMLRVRLCANHPAQYAIRPALEGDQSHVATMVAKLKSRRDLVVSLFEAIPNIRCYPPKAAFYAFPRLDIRRSDQEFVSDLIRETGVIVVPGSGFGQRHGSNHFRLVFLPPEEILRQAIGKIAQFSKGWR